MDVLPWSQSTAALNMARDLLLLESYPDLTVPRFRAYGWSEPAFTFGVSQRWSDYRPKVPVTATLIRRSTGGGLVSHLEDWTFALALPATHPVCDLEALESYGVVLQALAAGLQAQGQPVAMVPTAEGLRAFRAPEVCAERPEPHDLVNTIDGRKVAGAAQKRTREGLLLEGYVWRPYLPSLDAEKLCMDFTAALASALGTNVRKVSEPVYPKDAAGVAADKFSSAAWNERL